MSEPTLKLHRGVYVIQTIENGRRVRRSLGTSDKAEATRRLDHLKLTNAVIDRAKQKTIEELFEAYLINLSDRGRDTKHWRHIWKPLSPVFGASYPQYITPEKCAEYCKTRGVSAGSLHLELGLLRTIFHFAYKHKLIPNALFIYVPPKPPSKRTSLTRADVHRLLESTGHRHLRLFIVLGITTGARSNAILDLTWDRIDFDKRTIDLRLPDSVQRKGRAIVPINETAYRYLSEAYPLRRTEYVIEYGSHRIRSLSRTIANLGKKIGLYATPHMLRHSAAVWMAEGGVPMSEISQYLGHSNTAITERVYARYSPGYLQKAASHLEILD